MLLQVKKIGVSSRLKNWIKMLLEENLFK